MNNQIPIINYKKLLQELEASNQDSHLLLGNGFNNSLGVNTSYKGIFEKMKQNYKGYEILESDIETYNYDIEILIEKLKNLITPTETIDKTFLPQFTESKIKFDFMKAAYEIVKSKVKNIYQDKNQEIYLLFKNFTNYFSLNYDPFLYLILMKFKKSNDNSALALQENFSFIQEDLNKTQNNIYNKIQNLRKKGELQVNDGVSPSSIKNLSHVSKTFFQNTVKNTLKERYNWKNKDIERVCDYIWEQENNEKKLSNINDGFLFDTYNNNEQKLQNIFFLHGAFHIYEDNTIIRKVTQKQDKALYQRLEEIINAEEKDIVCVLTGTWEDKKKAIKENKYLQNNFNQLRNLNGYLVIFGSSLGDNDSHIFNQINQSQIRKIYISINPNNIEKDQEKATKIFPEKELCFFDYTTVSYQPENNKVST